MDMSDSQFEFEDRYDEDDFYDDVSVDDNNQDDSGMEEKAVSHNSYDTDTDNDNKNVTSQTPASRKPKKKSNSSGRLTNGKSSTNTRTPLGGTGGDPYKSYLTPTSRRVRSDPRGGRKPKKTENMSHSAASKGISMPSNGSSQNAVIKRVLSASRKKTSALHNVIFELQQQVEALTIANKDLKRSTRVQERDLRKLDSAEAQIPVLMKKHSNEINVLHEKYKRQREVNLSLTENLKKTDNELLKTKDRLKEYQVMVEQKNLGERIDLQSKILELEKVIVEKDNKILELNRGLSLQKKGHSRIIKEKNEKYEQLKEQVKHHEDIQEELLHRLKEREKALEITNIYSRRAPKDGKQVVKFSAKEPVAPILKRCQEDSLEIFEALEAKFKSPEVTNEVNSKNSVNDMIDTMVSRNDNDEEILQNISASPPATFVTEGKLKIESSEEFYDLNNRMITTKGKKPDGGIARDSLGEEALHEKLDQMIVKTAEEKTDTNKENISSKENSMEIVDEGKECLPPKLDKDTANKSSFESKISSDARKKQLILARIQAIDNGENPDEISPDFDFKKTNGKKVKSVNKKPIFLESTKTSVNVSDDDSAMVKSLEGYSSCDSKSSSANSKFRRNRPNPDTFSGSETDSAGKTRQRKDSWEFKNTDENLHKGLPAFADNSTSRTLPSTKRNSDRSLTGPLEPTSNATNGYKPTSNLSRNNGTNYSPTALDINNGPNRKVRSKKNDFDFFNQFEDPFKTVNKNRDLSPNSLFVGNTKNLDNPSSKKLGASADISVKPPDSPAVVDDLEEMFIL